MTATKSEFNAEQYASAYPSSMQYHYWSQARCELIYNRLQKHCLTKAKILEIGCGTGIVVSSLSTHQVDITGCELATIPKQLLLSHNIITGISAFDLPLIEREQYKTILLLDVLEHLENRNEFLDDIHSKFPNVEHLLITVPARQELWSNYDVFYGHKLRYDRNKMQDEVSNTNWILFESRYFFHFLYLPMRFLLKFTKKRDVKLSGPAGVSKLLHRMIGAIFALESRVIPGGVPGTSLVAHLKRGS